jgi:hypothetical protein
VDWLVGLRELAEECATVARSGVSKDAEQAAQIERLTAALLRERDWWARQSAIKHPGMVGPDAESGAHIAMIEKAIFGAPTTAKLVPVGILRNLNVLVAESLVSSGGSYFSHKEREEIKRWLADLLREEKTSPHV